MRPLILLVDDDLRNLQVLGKLLDYNYKTAIATNGLKALSFVRKMPPDLILMDVTMTKTEGFETCKKMKANSKTMDIPIIFVTNRTDTVSIARGFETGGTDYVPRPFNQSELIARITPHLALKNEGDERNRLITQLQEAREEINTLRALIPVCSFCKKRREDEEYWERVKSYMERETRDFAHGRCPHCLKEFKAKGGKT